MSATATLQVQTSESPVPAPTPAPSDANQASLVWFDGEADDNGSADDDGLAANAAGEGVNLGSWSAWSISLSILAILFLIVFVFFVVYYTWYRQVATKTPVESRRDSTKKERQTIFGVVVAIFSFFMFLILAMLLCLLTIIGLRKVEQKNLFQPTKLDRYRHISGTIYSLPAGGLLLNTTPGLPANTRRLLFLHGNTGNLELYREAFDRISDMGYDVWAVEYRGYGVAKFQDPSEEPSGDSVCQDAIEAWNVMGTPDSIVAGFSLGGAILAQVYEKLQPMPSQIVFLNSFGNLKQLLEDKMGTEFGGIAAPLMKTQWAIQAPKTYTGKVLVVSTADDLTINLRHGERLCQVFSKSDLVCRELPRGGHRFAVFTYIQGWVSELLPPIVPDM